MTRFSNHPEADSNPYDVGEPERNNGMTWDDYYSQQLDDIRLEWVEYEMSKRELLKAPW